jgi:hypothetical protein
MIFEFNAKLRDLCLYSQHKFYGNCRIMFLSLLLLMCLNGYSAEKVAASQRSVQFPSPMVETVRAHRRLENTAFPGLSIILRDVLTKPTNVYRTSGVQTGETSDLLFHFHGASYVPKHAVHSAARPCVLAVVNLGSGSSVYEKAFQNESVFPMLIERVMAAVSGTTTSPRQEPRIYLSSFSAGYGAVRAILKHHTAKIQGIALLDGLHTDYVPAQRVLAQGGVLNHEKLKVFVEFAQLALKGQKILLITHSEIFPGTYASSTETADFIIKRLGLKHSPVLKWGPVGMQMLSETRAKGLTILGFAGNTAPDHIDHFHGLPEFLSMILAKQANE